MKVKQFDDYVWLIERQINNWLKGVDVEITNVQYSISTIDDGVYASCLIFYQERYEHNMKNTEW